jgi:hypothetical protein
MTVLHRRANGSDVEPPRLLVGTKPPDSHVKRPRCDRARDAQDPNGLVARGHEHRLSGVPGGQRSVREFGLRTSSRFPPLEQTGAPWSRQPVDDLPVDKSLDTPGLVRLQRGGDVRPGDDEFRRDVSVRRHAPHWRHGQWGGRRLRNSRAWDIPAVYACLPGLEERERHEEGCHDEDDRAGFRPPPPSPNPDRIELDGHGSAGWAGVSRRAGRPDRRCRAWPGGGGA